MKEGPDISQIGALIGDPARANMLSALMSGRALTATELAQIAGVTVQTASSHLSKLEGGGLLAQRKQGRHRYFALADDAVGALLESLMGFAASRGHLRYQPGPKDPALRKARICYNHLAGDLGVQLLDNLLQTESLVDDGEELALTGSGQTRLSAFGIDIPSLQSQRRPMCRSCLDWSERRMHLAGSLGEALLARMIETGWAKRDAGSRVVQFSAAGLKEFEAMFG